MAWVSLWAAAVCAVNTNCFLQGWPRHFKAFVCELANDGSKDAYVSPYKYVCVHVCALVSMCAHVSVCAVYVHDHVCVRFLDLSLQSLAIPLETSSALECLIK